MAKINVKAAISGKLTMVNANICANRLAVYNNDKDRPLPLLLLQRNKIEIALPGPSRSSCLPYFQKIQPSNS